MRTNVGHTAAERAAAKVSLSLFLDAHPDISQTPRPRKYRTERELGPGAALLLALILSTGLWMLIWRIAKWVFG